MFKLSGFTYNGRTIYKQFDDMDSALEYGKDICYAFTISVMGNVLKAFGSRLVEKIV